MPRRRVGLCRPAFVCSLFYLFGSWSYGRQRLAVYNWNTAPMYAPDGKPPPAPVRAVCSSCSWLHHVQEAPRPGGPPLLEEQHPAPVRAVCSSCSWLHHVQEAPRPGGPCWLANRPGTLQALTPRVCSEADSHTARKKCEQRGHEEAQQRRKGERIEGRG